MSQSPNSFKNAARGISADMSREAIAKRVRIMDQLWKAAQKNRPLQVEQKRQMPAAAIVA